MPSVPVSPHTVVTDEPERGWQRIDQFLIESAGDVDGLESAVGCHDPVQMPIPTFLDKVAARRRLRGE